ncbi:MAG: response regulator transcription factor [Gemmatimonadaceae bacterium]|nr:response regulator transcription factor [Gemmatimonadaceae bacterium]
MKRHVLGYGVLGGLLIVLLRYVEYRYLVIEHSTEIYGALIALVFVSLGLGLGWRLNGRGTGTTQGTTNADSATAADALANDRTAFNAPAFVSPPLAADVSRDRAPDAPRITKREQEILELMAAGLSNKEIADRLFVSENTVKTHSSRLFEKLNVKRRTQAIQVGQQVGLLK